MEKTIEEKIDYIYTVTKKQESRYKMGLYFKWGFRVLILGYIYYFMMIFIPNYFDGIKDKLTPNVRDTITESIENIDSKLIYDKIKSVIK